MDVKTALSKLDHSNDEQWTGDGLPRVEVIQEMVGDESITRKMITDADPKFVRLPEGERPEPATDNAPPAPEPTTGEAPPSAEPALVQSSEEEDEVPSAENEVQEPVDPDAGEQEPPSEDDVEEFEDLPDVPETIEQALELDGKAFVDDRDLFPVVLGLMDAEIARIDAEVKKLGEMRRFVSSRRTQLAQHQINTEPRGNAKQVWLARQNEIRAARAARTREFLASSGARASEVREALDPRSRLDASLQGRERQSAAKTQARMQAEAGKE